MSEVHCKRCCKCVGCEHDAASFFVEHPWDTLSHNYGCPNAKPGEPIDLKDRCLYCKGDGA